MIYLNTWYLISYPLIFWQCYCIPSLLSWDLYIASHVFIQILIYSKRTLDFFLPLMNWFFPFSSVAYWGNCFGNWWKQKILKLTRNFIIKYLRFWCLPGISLLALLDPDSYLEPRETIFDIFMLPMKSHLGVCLSILGFFLPIF